MGRPSRRLLDREQIARAALDLLDRDGPSGVGMRTIARHLGVQAPSLYNHVTSQDDVIDLVHELVDTEIDIALLDAVDAARDDWRQAFEAFARSYRAAFLRHPYAVSLVTRRPMRGRTALGVYEALSAALQRLGLPVTDVMTVLGVLDFAVLGSTVDAFIEAFAEPDDPAHDALPVLRETLRATDRRTVDDDAFALALRLLLDDVERRLAVRRSRGPGQPARP